MAKKRVINGKTLEFAKKLFAKPEEKSIEKSKKVEKPKETCPYCGKDYVNVKRHLRTCIENPDRIEVKPKVVAAPTSTTVKRKVIIEEEVVQKVDWTNLILESVNTLRDLGDYLREIKEEGVKIKMVK